jgi:hypothetical protein
MAAKISSNRSTVQPVVLTAAVETKGATGAAVATTSLRRRHHRSQLPDGTRQRALFGIAICLALLMYGLLTASKSTAGQIAFHMLVSHASNGGIRAREVGEPSREMVAMIDKHRKASEEWERNHQEINPLCRTVRLGNVTQPAHGRGDSLQLSTNCPDCTFVGRITNPNTGYVIWLRAQRSNGLGLVSFAVEQQPDEAPSKWKLEVALQSMNATQDCRPRPDVPSVCGYECPSSAGSPDGAVSMTRDAVLQSWCVATEYPQHRETWLNFNGQFVTIRPEVELSSAWNRSMFGQSRTVAAPVCGNFTGGGHWGPRYPQEWSKNDVADRYVWYQDGCRTSTITPPEFAACLASRRLAMVGDSTLRNVFYDMVLFASNHTSDVTSRDFEYSQSIRVNHQDVISIRYFETYG